MGSFVIAAPPLYSKAKVVAIILHLCPLVENNTFYVFIPVYIRTS